MRMGIFTKDISKWVSSMGSGSTSGLTVIPTEESSKEGKAMAREFFATSTPKKKSTRDILGKT